MMWVWQVLAALTWAVGIAWAGVQVANQALSLWRHLKSERQDLTSGRDRFREILERVSPRAKKACNFSDQWYNFVLRHEETIPGALIDDCISFEAAIEHPHELRRAARAINTAMGEYNRRVDELNTFVSRGCPQRYNEHGRVDLVRAARAAGRRLEKNEIAEATPRLAEEDRLWASDHFDHHERLFSQAAGELRAAWVNGREAAGLRGSDS